MSDDTSERQIRLVHFLANGCTKLTRALVEKLVENSKPNDPEQASDPWTLDDFLYEHQGKLSNIKNEAIKKKLFPGRHKETNTEEWDICLFCLVIMRCSENNMVKQDIRVLRSIRNKVIHTKIEKEQFDHFVSVIEVIVTRCCDFIANEDFAKEIKAFLDEFKKGNVVKNDDDLKMIKEWYENDPFAELNSKVDGLSNDHQLMFDKMNEMMTLLQTLGLSHVKLPDTNVEIIVKNCNSEKEKAISEHLVKLLTPKMTELDLHDVPEAYKDKIKELVKEAMSELLKGGRELQEIYHACVNLTIRCPSYENMRYLWMSCVDGKLTNAFKCIEKYLQNYAKSPELELEIGITHFEFNRCLEATVMEITKTVQSATQIHSASLGSKEEVEALSYESLITNVQDTTNEDGSLVILNVQPSSFVQAESLWEACRSDAFNEKLHQLALLLQRVYGCTDLDISAKLEEESPYDSVFKYKKTRVGISESTEEAMNEQDVIGETKNQSRDRNTPDDIAELPFIDLNRPRVEDLIHKHQEFQQKLESLGESNRRAVMKKSEIENAESMLKDLEKVIRLKNEEDVIEALKKEMEILELQLVQCRTEYEELGGEMLSKTKDVRDTIGTIQTYLRSIIPDLKLQVKRGQTELINTYAEFSESGFPDTLAHSCSDVGFVLHELMTSDLNRWAQLETESSRNEKCRAVDDMYTRMYNYVCSEFKDLLQSTLVVTDQSDYCIRLFKKQLPTITVRLLAGDRIDIRTIEVKVLLLPEDHVAFKDRVIHVDISDYYKLKGEKKMFTRHKADPFVLTFSKLELESEDFEKIKSQHLSSNYFKQLYRFVFVMSIEGNQYSTISLPVVVTTDASECCCALGAIMWYCFDKDVFALPLERQDQLTWSKIAEMLKRKFLRLCHETSLSEGHLNHLKRRLTGQASTNANVMIPLSKFCFDPLGAGCKFSFWKWVLANYNLIEKYLKRYWEEGLIGGFLSRNDVETMFRGSSGIRSGTFILRFSDNHITDSVGTKSVFGYLTAMVVVKIEVQEGDTTRIVPRYEAVEVADHNKLRKTPLANILKDSMDKRHANNIYKYLYPGMRRREDTFDKHCLTERSLPGYVKQQDAFIIELEQGMFVLNNPIRRQNSDSSDSGDSGLSYSRSSSPARDESNSGIYQQAESLDSLSAELVSPSTPVNNLPNFEKLFSLPNGTAIFEGEELTNAIESDTRILVNEATIKLKHWLKQSPELLERVLKFLLVHVPNETLIRLRMYEWFS